MNLQEFLNYRKNCPFCDEKLHFYLYSSKFQEHRYEEGRIIVTSRLNSLKKHQIDYKMGHSFGLNDKSWYIEFYTQDDKRFEVDSPLHLRNRFKELDGNLQGYWFYKKCSKCDRYHYYSNKFIFDYKLCSTGELNISDEYYGFAQPVDSKYKIYKILLSHTKNITHINYGKAESDVWARADSAIHMQALQISKLLDMSAPQETLDRIKKMIVFS